jgi:hypothetical protein
VSIFSQLKSKASYNFLMSTQENILFKKALSEELQKRAKKNPGYSIRSFARFLELEPSSLAQILSGKRKLTDKMCQRLGKRLGYGPIKMRALAGAEVTSTATFKKFMRLEDVPYYFNLTQIE